jgi:serine/threonine protein phosphatase PrpC
MEFVSQSSLRFQLGCDTDIGGGRENQDESFVWIRKEYNLIVLCCLDGHGREVGRIAALAAKASLIQFLETNHLDLLNNPVEFLVRAHETAPQAKKETLRQELEKQGLFVRESDDGYLMKRRSGLDYWSCVHGGTACTLVALVGKTVYIANVGDSTAILCSAHPLLNKSILQYQVDAARNSSYNGHSLPQSDVSASSSLFKDSPCAEELNRYLLLSAEHSPESPYEYDRLRRFRQRENDPSQPALLVVYDSSTHDKSLCHAVFDASAPSLVPSQKGR